VWELSKQLPDNAVVTGDAGSTTSWWARHLKVKQGNLASLSGGLATMGSAVPYAIAAKFAYPERPVIAIVGDGAFQMNGMNELLTVKRYWKTCWSESPTLVFCVFDNRDLNQVTWEQRVMAGDPKYEASQSLPGLDYAGYAELCGLHGISCESGDRMADAWDEALSSDRPCVLHVRVDPEVPPLPPHISFEQAEMMTKALLKGDPEGVGIVQKSLRGKLAELRRSLT
jgi:pyruvate dehydrogenase (quinone)